MNILISGATGLVGRRLTDALKDLGHKTGSLGRADFSGPSEILASKVSKADVVINLAGAPIMARWTESYKKEITDSRILSTRKLVEAMTSAPVRPALFISASAIGIYPETGISDESRTDYATGFLSEVCQHWEAEALKAKPYTKVAIFRLGLVLSNEGGALKQLLPVFRLGLGGTLAGGKQGFPWIHINDLVRAFNFVIDKNPEGVFNLVAPQSTDNYSFTKTLGKVLKRPAILAVPAFALRLLYGAGAAPLITGQNVIPVRLKNEGFVFRFPELKEALQDLV